LKRGRGREMDFHADPLIEAPLRAEAAGAMRVLSRAQTSTVCVAILAALCQLACYWMAQRSAVMEPLRRSILAGAGDQRPWPTPDEAAAALRAREAVESALIWSGLFGSLALLVLASNATLALHISITSRLGGVAMLTQAFVWAVLAFGLALPWLEIGALARGGVAGGVSGGGTMFSAASQAGAWKGLLHVTRFAICPIGVAVLVALAQSCFRRGSRTATAPAPGKLPIHEV
jgi:hypothetical protein